MIELGGNIALEGFEALEPSTLVVVRKMVGNCAKKIAEQKGAFQKLQLTLESSGSEKCEISAKISINSKEFSAKVSENNLFFAINSVLEKLSKEIS